MTERKPERYRHHPDMDRSTAGDRIPIGARRHEFAEGVYVGTVDNGVHLPPSPVRPSHWDIRMAEIKAHRARKARIHARIWLGIFLAALVVGALLMVAVTARG